MPGDRLFGAIPKDYGHFHFVEGRNRTLKNLHKHPEVQNADIINLHWVADFIDWKTFFKKVDKPLVWTLHDIGPFTGGCHYSMGCDHFKTTCHDCPIPLPQNFRHLPKKQLVLKKKAISKTKSLHIVSPSSWLKKEAESSSLFAHFRPIQYIPYSISASAFFNVDPEEKKRLKAHFQLNPDKPTLLFVADRLDTPRKGFDLLLNALQELEDLDIQALAVGEAPKEEALSTPIPIQFTGYLDGPEAMAKAYQAADVFVIPSREDNLPNTVLESLACGTPVIGFDIGGIPDMIDHGNNGILAGPPDSKYLATAIRSYFKESVSWSSRKISEHAHQKYAPEKQAKAYMDIYTTLKN